MELAFYTLGLLCSLLVIFMRSKAVENALFFVIVAYIISARLAPPEVDMGVYYHYLSNFRPYMLKEFLYYGVTTALYSILRDPNLVFIFIDLATLGFLRAFALPELGRTRTILFLAIFFFSFVGVMGLQNVYRQFLASILLLFGFIALDQKRKKSAFIVAISAVFIHNAAIIVAMILFISNISKAFVQRNLIYLAGLCSIAAVLYAYFTFDIRLKSNRDTGANMLFVYFVLVAVAFMTFASLAHTRKAIVLKSALFLIFLLPIFGISGGSTAGERIFMFCFPIFLYETLKYLRNLIFKDQVMELIIFVIFCGPVLAVYSSRQFLT